jgi:tetratricopeptide (TPR) repeat protein
MAYTNALDSVYFIKLPENFNFKTKEFVLDSNIMLPVQKKDGQEEETFNIENLSEEQILSGILTVLAYDTKNENLDYYRKFILDVRPDIKKELYEAALIKTQSEDWDLAEEIWLALKGLSPEDKIIILNLALFFDQKADSYRRTSLNDDADAYDDIALKYYIEVMDSDTEIPDAYFNAGFFYLKKRNYSEAKASFENYLALVADAKDEELGENGIYKKERAQEIINKISNRNLEK